MTGQQAQDLIDQPGTGRAAIEDAAESLASQNSTSANKKPPRGERWPAMLGALSGQRELGEWNWLAPCRVDLGYWEIATMSVQDEDYRTNRADYAIAADGRAILDGDRDERLARKKKSLWLSDRRSAKLAANPSDSSPEPKSRPRV